jgi:hypothetical protein
MKCISPKNHAKVFNERNDKVELWAPVKEYILKENNIYNS